MGVVSELSGHGGLSAGAVSHLDLLFSAAQATFSPRRLRLFALLTATQTAARSADHSLAGHEMPLAFALSVAKSRVRERRTLGSVQVELNDPPARPQPLAAGAIASVL